MIKKAFMFLALTIWILFVSLFVLNMNSFSAFKQHEVVFECMKEAVKRKEVDITQYTYAFTENTGTVYRVVLSKPHPDSHHIVTCNFNKIDGGLEYYL